MFNETFLAVEDEIAPEAKAAQAHNNPVNVAIDKSQKKLLSLQNKSGYWAFELEADCTIPSEYIMMMNYIGDINLDLQNKIANYLRAKQTSEGYYTLFIGGKGDISCSVKAYYARKMAGDDINTPQMTKLREYILSQGGATKANVFTRIALATFKQLPWRAVPFIPVEIMLLPKWFPFHLDKVSYWSRTVMVPLFIICSHQAVAKNPNNIDIQELFIIHPDKEKHYFPERTLLNKFFLVLDKLGRITSPFYPKKIQQLATKKATDWFVERLNGEDGLGGIFPAMVNSYEAMILLGYPKNHKFVVVARKAIDKLLVINENSAYCQPCLSPVWDTGLATLALQEADNQGNSASLLQSYNWLKTKQLGNEAGDWRVTKPDLKGGGWAFQYNNPHYPDVDDTALVAFAMTKSCLANFDKTVHKAARWIVGMQSKNGGYGAFDVDNTYYYLNEIPFADHGALLDPPTADVSARCVMLLAYLAQDHAEYRPALKLTIDYIRNEQEPDGSWFGRWGTNYIYGTWSVLLGLEQTNIPTTDSLFTKAVSYLKSVQHADGGWGEGNNSYYTHQEYNTKYVPSTAFQTAWAVLGLIAAGQVNSPEVKSGIDFIISTQQGDGTWDNSNFTAPGFPKIFFLKYHGYSTYFPLWSLARYRNELDKSVKTTTVL